MSIIKCRVIAEDIRFETLEELYNYEHYADIYELTMIWCELPDLSKLPPYIRKLDCGRNKLIEIDFDKLPKTLEVLECYDNRIIELKNLDRSNLRVLNCNSNKIKEINLLPESLLELNCSYNEIEKLNVPDSNLMVLDCRQNNMRNLILPCSLRELYCSGNKLYEFKVPSNLMRVDCDNIDNFVVPKCLTILNGKRIAPYRYEDGTSITYTDTRPPKKYLEI
jgi:Leucine-rich repeat (LRR) protein